MTDTQVGRMFRAVRHRRHQRQIDVAVRARVSRHVVSRIERGRLTEVSIRSLRRVADALEIHVDLMPRWRGGELDRLVNRRHAALHEVALAMVAASPGWEVISEASFAIGAERGIIDLLAWHAKRRALLIQELKSEFVDPQELVGTMDKRRRLAVAIARQRGWDPAIVGMWVGVEDDRTNRRHLARAHRLLRGAFPHDGHAMRAWLRDPAAPIEALSFLTPARGASTRQRVRPPTAQKPPVRRSA